MYIPVIDALSQANRCPWCGKFHKSGSRALMRCADQMTEVGYLGYDYDYERWVAHGDVPFAEEA